MIKKLLMSLLLFGFTSITFTGNYTLKCLAANAGQSTQSPYAGQYIEIWADKESKELWIAGELFRVKQTGKWILSIDANGKVKGKMVNDTAGLTADISGSISDDGQILLIFQYPGFDQNTLKGTVTKTKTGHLKGMLTRHSGREVLTFEIDLAPTSPEPPRDNMDNWQKAKEFAGEAYRLKEQKKYLKAIENYTIALGLDPSYCMAYLGRGEVKSIMQRGFNSEVQQVVSRRILDLAFCSQVFCAGVC